MHLEMRGRDGVVQQQVTRVRSSDKLLLRVFVCLQSAKIIPFCLCCEKKVKKLAMALRFAMKLRLSALL